MEKAVMNWSGGKDSCLALHYLLQDSNYEICTLLTSVNAQFQRISMHGVQRELLVQQAACIGSPLRVMEIPEMPSMEVYENVMSTHLKALKNQGITTSVFGDIFLEDLRKYREDKLNQIGMKALFPLWGKNTKELIREFIDLGYKTIVVCVNEQFLDKSFVGRVIDHHFIADLPDNVDPCGENGEFHTFVVDGPLFKFPVKYKLGEKVRKTYKAPKCNLNDDNEGEESLESAFWFIDLIPS